MEELQKTEMRNYAMVAGFPTIATYFLLYLMQIYTGLQTGSIPDLGTATLATAIVLILAGVILVILRKRDVSAVTFLMTGMLYAFFFFNPGLGNATLLCIIGVIFLILALIILTSPDTTKYLMCVIPALIGLRLVLGTGYDPINGAQLVIAGVLVLVCLYFALAAAAERVALPLGKVLRADTATDFKASGSVLGYLLFALPLSAYAVYYFLPGSFGHEGLLYLDSVTG